MAFYFNNRYFISRGFFFFFFALFSHLSFCRFCLSGCFCNHIHPDCRLLAHTFEFLGQLSIQFLLVPGPIWSHVDTGSHPFYFATSEVCLWRNRKLLWCKQLYLKTWKFYNGASASFLPFEQKHFALSIFALSNAMEMSWTLEEEKVLKIKAY